MKVTANDIYVDFCSSKESTVNFFTKWSKVSGKSPAKMFVERYRRNYNCSENTLLKAAKMIGLAS